MACNHNQELDHTTSPTPHAELPLQAVCAVNLWSHTLPVMQTYTWVLHFHSPLPFLQQQLYMVEAWYILLNEMYLFISLHNQA